MASTKVKALVLESRDYKEKDKLVTLFTLENGKITAVMRGVKGEKAKLKSAKEIFAFGDYIIENTKGMNVVTQADIIDSFFALTQDLDKFYEGCAILDIVKKITRDEPNPQLFIETLKALQALCYSNINKYYIIDKFLIKVFSDLGYFFLSDKCSGCGAKLADLKYFNLDVGELVCPACRNDTCVPVSGPCFSALRLLSATDYGKLSNLKLGGGGEVQAFHLLEKNFEWRTGAKFCSIPN